MFGEVVAQSIEATLPARTPIDDPLLGHLQRSRFHTAGANPPHLFRLDEAARFEDVEMLNHGREGDGKRTGEIADRRRPTTEPLDHHSACRVR